MRTLDALDVRGKRVLVRVDFNVPLQAGEITDDTRIRAALPTLEKLLEAGASTLILASHLGRPKKYDPTFSMAPVASRASELLARDVVLLPMDLDEAREALHALSAGSVAMLENTRFFAGEEKNDPGLAQQLASLADVYVNDAFGSAHRAHASTEAVARLLPSAAGLVLQQEVDALQGVLQSPERPFTAVLGGAKVSGKIGVIDNLWPLVDHLLIGGAMANTFLLAQGHEVGKSLVESDRMDVAKRLLDGEAAAKLHLPIDFVVADALDRADTARVVPADAVPPGVSIFDIGPQTVERFSNIIRESGTVVWNGPMGVFEQPPFDAGTVAVAGALAECGGRTVVGGGDSLAAVQRSGVADRIGHLSTGGGASLELLEGRELPGVAALERSDA